MQLREIVCRATVSSTPREPRLSLTPPTTLLFSSPRWAVSTQRKTTVQLTRRQHARAAPGQLFARGKQTDEGASRATARGRTAAEEAAHSQSGHGKYREMWVNTMWGRGGGRHYVLATWVALNFWCVFDFSNARVFHFFLPLFSFCCCCQWKLQLCLFKYCTELLLLQFVVFVVTFLVIVTVVNVVVVVLQGSHLYFKAYLFLITFQLLSLSVLLLLVFRISQNNFQQQHKIALKTSIGILATTMWKRVLPRADNNDYHSFHLQFFPLLFSVIALGS